MRLLCFPRVLKSLAFFSAQLYMKKKMMNSDFTSVSNELIFINRKDLKNKISLANMQTRDI
jgi:hypothetical protein